MGRKSLAIPAALLLLSAASTGARGQGDVTHCVGIEDAQARLACFDAATRGASPATAAAAAVATSTAPAKEASGAAASAPTVPATAADASKSAEPSGGAEFGLAERKETPEKITATVRSVESHTVPGRWVVTLDNDQVWEQRETTAANRRPKPGDSVTIEPSSFGSYLMVTTGRGSSRVKRIR